MSWLEFLMKNLSDTHALIERKLRMPQIQGKGEAVVGYCEPLVTKVEDPVNSGEMGYHPAL